MIPWIAEVKLSQDAPAGMSQDATTRMSSAPVESETGRTRIDRDPGRARAYGVQSAALANRESRVFHDEDDPLDPDVCPHLVAGRTELARLSREGHRPDPWASDRPAGGPTMLSEAGGELLGFQLIEELGRGAFGKVYLARQGDLADRLVALKVTTSRSGESQTLAQLQHTNIVPIHSTHRVGHSLAVCMPYFGATTLKDVYEYQEDHDGVPQSGRDLVSVLNDRRGRPRRLEDPSPSDGETVRSLDASTAQSPASTVARSQSGQSEGTLRHLESLTYVQAVLWMFSRVASGLAHAHERGILHRDLKPANILLTDEGQPMLLDFNMSEDVKHRLGAAASIGGTLHYMAPEHLYAFRGDPRPVDARSDLYAIGVMLYELLAGRRPHAIPDGPPDAVIERLIEERLKPPPPARCWNRAITPAIESIIHHCLEPDPARRYQTALELHEDMERHLADRPLRHAAEPSLRERSVKWARRHPAALSSTTISCLGLLVISSLAALGWRAAHESRIASARLHLVEFRAAFEECQLLLNTSTDEGSSGHLARGVRLGRETLDGYGVGGTGDWTEASAVRNLPAADQRALREEVSELVQLVVRARITLAEPQGTGGERGRALQEGVTWLDAAEWFDPRPPAALFEDRGRYHAALGKHILADRDRTLAARVPPQSSRDFYLLGTSLLTRGEVDRAERSLTRAVTLDPRQFWAWFTLGICHADQGRHSDAACDFSVCTTLAPGLAWAHLNRGLALARSGRLHEASAAYDRALEIDAGFTEALANRALISLELDDPARALHDLDRALALGRTGPAVQVARAEACARLGRRTEAEGAYAEVIRTNPDDPMPLVARGFSRLSGDRAGAEGDFSGALALAPHDARARLGRAHLLRGDDPRAALAEVESALAEAPDLNDALQLRALLRARLGDPAAETDVDRLLLIPTPQRLYNAACSLSLLSRSKDDPRLVMRALDLLQRALDSGLPSACLAEDPDLDALRLSPRFSKLLAFRAPHAP
jgi:eukaryotic-like serine/threonine-protein kinase